MDALICRKLLDISNLVTSFLTGCSYELASGHLNPVVLVSQDSDVGDVGVQGRVPAQHKHHSQLQASLAPWPFPP
jgi:hypothetical protein